MKKFANLNKRVKIILGAVIVIVIAVAGVIALAANDVIDLPLFGTVNGAMNVTPNPACIAYQKSLTFTLVSTPIDPNITLLSSDNPAIAVPNLGQGRYFPNGTSVVNGVARGATQLRVTNDNGKSYLTIPVTVAYMCPVNPTLHIGQTLQMTSTYMTNGWFSDVGFYATVSQTGLVTAKQVGTTTIYSNYYCPVCDPTYTTVTVVR